MHDYPGRIKFHLMTTFLFKGIDIGEAGTPVKASKREEGGEGGGKARDI